MAARVTRTIPKLNHPEYKDIWRKNSRKRSPPLPNSRMSILRFPGVPMVRQMLLRKPNNPGRKRQKTSVMSSWTSCWTTSKRKAVQHRVKNSFRDGLAVSIYTCGNRRIISAAPAGSGQWFQTHCGDPVSGWK